MDQFINNPNLYLYILNHNQLIQHTTAYTIQDIKLHVTMTTFNIPFGLGASVAWPGPGVGVFSGFGLRVGPTDGLRPGPGVGCLLGDGVGA